MLCILQGYRLFSEEICNEYAAQTMFFQIQSFRQKKNRKSQIFVWLFLIPKNFEKNFQNKPKLLKKARISKSDFKKAKLATVVDGVKRNF